MCGIIGVFGRKDAKALVEKGMLVLKNRGRDAKGIYFKGNNCVGHLLHSIVGFLKQPLIGKGVFGANCEIYNWKELNKKYSLNAKNDSDLIFKLLEKRGIEDIKNILEELDGVYAFFYWIENHIFLARDIIGEKPIWFSNTDGFAFASEKKALEKSGYLDIVELNPRQILKYNIKENSIQLINRDFFKIEPEIKDKLETIKNNVKSLLIGAVKRRLPETKFGLLFSGGLDSAVIASILKKLGKKFNCYTAVLEDNEMKQPHDLIAAKYAADALGLKLNVVKIKLNDVEKYLKKIVPLIEDSNVVKVGVALTFFEACSRARKDGCKVVFSGLGSEEIFAGYKRHKDSANINKECLSGLLKLYERDLYRDDVITMFNSLELRLPFLDKKLVDYCLKIPGEYKIKNNQEKYILRLAAKDLGLKKEIYERKKKAAQYGSNFHKAIGKLARRNKFKLKSDYLRQFYPSHNLKLGALVSSGKDSIYAMYVMLKQNYKIGCLITIKSKNPDSFMFHTPSVDLVRLQAESMNIPLVEFETKGEKEEELKDLKKALEIAKKEHKIEGVVTGALYSTYQRDRIEKICDDLGLKIFSPLWHINQETELREILNAGFKFILASVAADGLDKSFLGKTVDNEFVDKLKKISEKNRMNIAGEGGEYESFVVDGPIFNRKIKILDYEIKEESRNTAKLIIKKAELVEK
ncbi:MAG: diphthine--ammonia ligase [Candidatus Woesearchaeota archaeon]|nr:diphthine--ammonia ligase [Candidatus Woesearchaeota archaeon]